MKQRLALKASGLEQFQYKRKLEARRIEQANQKIIKSIMSAKPSIIIAEMVRDFSQHKQLSKSI